MSLQYNQASLDRNNNRYKFMDNFSLRLQAEMILGDVCIHFLIIMQMYNSTEQIPLSAVHYFKTTALKIHKIATVCSVVG